MFCYKCGSEIPDNARICPFCGETLVELEEDSKEITIPQTSVMSSSNQIMNYIKEELQKRRPASNKILNLLLDLRRKAEFQQLSDSEFFNIVGETFHLRPDFYMSMIYKPFRNKLRKLIGDDKLREMEKFIIEKYNLHEGEHISYIFDGSLIQNAKMLKPFFIESATFFFTNHRVITQGKLKGPFHRYSSELDIYGYVIPTRKIFRLRRVRNNIRYRIMLGDRQSEISIKITLGESEAKREELINELLEILNKEVVQEIAS